MAAIAQRYTAVAIVLHWAIAAAILFLIPLGFWMRDQAEDGENVAGLFGVYQLHKSIGLTVLALSLVRLGWRIANPPPPLPAHMPGWERFIAKATHWAFYGVMIALPLTGWLYVSAGWSVHDGQSLAVQTRWFGLFDVPALFGLSQADAALRADVAEAAIGAHGLLAFTAIGLAALHVAAALKHHWFDKDETLAHMVPGLRAPFEESPPRGGLARRAILGVGLAAVAVGIISAATMVAIFTSAPAPAASAIEIAAPPPSDAAPEAPPEPGAPTAWRVNEDASAIRFSYVYRDTTGETPMQGRFARWRADIRFDPADLEASYADVTIETASAATGAALHDSTLRGAGWFNTGAFPRARFRADDIRAREGGYEARGELTIRDRTRDVRLPFTLTIDGDRAVMDGRVSVDRSDFDLGDGADGDEEVSREVVIIVHVEATRTP